jgi:hypothetical protein
VKSLNSFLRWAWSKWPAVCAHPSVPQLICRDVDERRHPPRLEMHTPTSRTRAGYSTRRRLVQTTMNHPSANTAGGTEGSEFHRRTGSPRLTNRCADGIGGTDILRWLGTPVRQQTSSMTRSSGGEDTMPT